MLCSKNSMKQALMSKSLNSTFLVLIPKVEGIINIRDFRSISLIGGAYKLLANVLAKKMAMVAEKVIATSQYAFVRNNRLQM